MALKVNMYVAIMRALGKIKQDLSHTQNAEGHSPEIVTHTRTKSKLKRSINKYKQTGYFLLLLLL